MAVSGFSAPDGGFDGLQASGGDALRALPVALVQPAGTWNSLRETNIAMENDPLKTGDL